jgi:type IV secretion system protein TrbL
MVLTLVLGIGNGIFQALQVPAGNTVTTYQAFCIALAALLLMVLSLVASRLATDMIIGGPSLGVGTALNTTAVAYNTTVGAASSRPALAAVRAAAAVPMKGATLIAQVGSAAARTIRGVGSAGTVAVASAVPSSSATRSVGAVAANSASRVPGPSNPPIGNGGSSGAGGPIA